MLNGQWISQSQRINGLAIVILMVVIAMTASPRQVDAQPREHIRSFFDAEQNFYGWLNHTDGRQIGDVAPFTSLGGTKFFNQQNGLPREMRPKV